MPRKRTVRRDSNVGVADDTPSDVLGAFHPQNWDGEVRRCPPNAHSATIIILRQMITLAYQGTREDGAAMSDAEKIVALEVENSSLNAKVTELWLLPRTQMLMLLPPVIHCEPSDTV